jgi:hypothetical protein
VVRICTLAVIQKSSLGGTTVLRDIFRGQQ